MARVLPDRNLASGLGIDVLAGNERRGGRVDPALGVLVAGVVAVVGEPTVPRFLMLAMVSALLALLGLAVAIERGRELAVKLPRYVPPRSLSGASRGTRTRAFGRPLRAITGWSWAV